MRRDYSIRNHQYNLRVVGASPSQLKFILLIKTQKMQNFNQQVGLSESVKFITVNGGNFTDVGNFTAYSINGDECHIPSKVMEGAGVDKNTIKFPFYVIAKAKTHKWYVDKQGELVRNPTPEQVVSESLVEKSIIDRMTGTIIFKTKEEAASNFGELATGKDFIVKSVAKATQSLELNFSTLEKGTA